MNHAWIFRQTATGRRMSVEGHAGQVLNPDPGITPSPDPRLQHCFCQ